MELQLSLPHKIALAVACAIAGSALEAAMWLPQHGLFGEPCVAVKIHLSMLVMAWPQAHPTIQSSEALPGNTTV